MTPAMKGWHEMIKTGIYLFSVCLAFAAFVYVFAGVMKLLGFVLKLMGVVHDGEF